MSRRQIASRRRFSQRQLRRIRREKRGIILLVVVSILTLFLMIGVTYVLVAGNYQSASANSLRSQRYGDEPEREAEEVLGQILFGNRRLPPGARTVLGSHSLLEDLYGNDFHSGTINATGVTVLNGGQTLAIQFTPTPPLTVQPIPQYFAGRVITFTSGPAAGISTRVMGYIPNIGGGSPILMVEAPESDLPIPVIPTDNNTFWINGAPFNGTGPGYAATTYNLDAPVTINGTNYAAAYLPNYPFYPTGSIDPALGGMDETFDAADYMNMFLAFIPPRKLQQGVPSRAGNEALVPPLPILPSYHRPDLVRFWRDTLFGSLLSGVAQADRRRAFLYPYGPDGQLGTGDDWPGLTPTQAQDVVALKRMIILRPLREDHPNFTGSNSNFLEDAIPYYENDTDMNGLFDTDNDGDAVYDVDNDGDGIAESIWVDAGLPVVTDKSGRRYKRLVAICIKDLDGRVDPRVHGNSLLATTATARTASPLTDTFAGMDPSAATPVYLPRGLGFGGAEVDFMHILGDDAAVYNSVLLQRYFSASNQVAQPGYSDPANPLNPLNDDGWSRLKTIGMPGVLWNPMTLQFDVVNAGDHTNPPLSAYSLPPDVWGRAALAVDYTGQPLWYYAGLGERINDPYEVQWDSRRATFDEPYTVAELEALLRYHDLGAANLPSRLMQLAGVYLGLGPGESRGTPSLSQVRRDALGMGSYIPVPKMIVPREARPSFGAATSNTILDLYYLRTGGDPSYFQTIVPFELLKGQLFNLNRELGNGVQDPTGADPAGANAAPYGTVDDPTESGSELIPTTDGPRDPSFFRNDSTPADPRHLYARHLYCLMMALRNQGAPDGVDYNRDGTGSPPETARYFAQWAVNVVDFRDADSIMTPFEYDINPFNGWSVDGVVGSADDTTTPERGLVWGCERPELLIMENMSGHDRRTEDLPDDGPNSNNRQVADPELDATNDFDQRLMPQGWTFIELYNPWYDRTNGAADHKPAELYGAGGVDLSKTNVAGSPVWRMVIVRGTNHNQTDPDYPAPEALTVVNGMPPPAGTPNVDRTIYFADLNAAGVNRPIGANDGEVYFPSASIPRVALAPGRYAVVGSAGEVDGGAGTYTTYIGRTTADTGFDPSLFDRANTRRIVLNPTAQTVRVQNNQVGGGGDDVNLADFQPTVAIPVDTVIRNGVAAPQSFNISEPVGGYLVATPPPASSVWQPPGANDEGHFAPAADAPFDVSRMDDGAIFAQDLTTTNYRTVHLQRLANPLLPWNPVTNPYMTIDSSSMDVMSYNGVADVSMDPQRGGAPRQNFQTFQRGGRFYATDTPAVDGYAPPMNPIFRQLWPQEPLGGAPTQDSPMEMGTATHFQPHPLFHTLGHLNKRYQPYFGAAAPAIYRGAPYFQDPTGAIASPFPYLAFNNRPFNNPMELLQVPTWHSSRLLAKFNSQNLLPMPTWYNMYEQTNSGATYPHLANFFQTANDPSTPSTSPELSRILDYVETRTPYLQTEKYYKPDAPVNFLADPATPAGYRPPFNYLSRFREPGRININTIFDSFVWDAAVRGYPNLCTLNPPTEGDGGLFLTHLVLSRQGYGTSAADVLQHDPSYPSLFSQPFRTADSSDMMPPNPLASAPFLPRKSPADGGLLRRDANPYPLPGMMVDDNRPLFASDDITPRQDASRNPYFRYQALQKVGNVFSTTSNCYAVWITIGYFEVEQNPGGSDLAHPDGLRLAGEVGADSGEVKRHRAFYIIDRSVPVAYEPGHRHNTDKAVLLKRFIE